MDVELIRKKLGVIPDFPKKGIVFLDIFPILRDPVLFEVLITHLVHHITSHTIPNAPDNKIHAIVGLDARGFLLGPIIAARIGASFVPVRKAGKLPGSTIKATYTKEYGEAGICDISQLFEELKGTFDVLKDIFEMQADSLTPGSNVVVVDDLIATGGSAFAAGELVKQLGAKTVEYIFVIGLPFLKGSEKLDAPAYMMIEANDD